MVVRAPTAPGRTHRGRSGARRSRRHRTGRPRRSATARRTCQWCGCPCATTGLPDPSDLARPGSVRRRAAGSTVRTGTARPAPGSTMRPGAGGEDCGGQLVGDADLTFGPCCGHRVDEPFRGGLFGPEVAGDPTNRQHQQPRPQHLGPRHDVVDRGRHDLEVAGIACRIGGDDVQLRTTRLSLPAAQPTPHTDRAGRRRTCHDAVGQGDRYRVGRGQPRCRRRGHRGPVHAPDGQHPGPRIDRTRHSPTA